MPIETDIKPETRKNFLPGANFGIVFRLGSGSGPPFIVFAVLNVFRDIHYFLTLAKVKNLGRFLSIPLQNYFFVAFIFLSQTVLAVPKQDKPSSFELIFISVGVDSLAKKVHCTSENQVLKVLQNEIQVYHENGFPFASFTFDTITYTPSAVIRISVSRGPEIRNGELLVHGDSSLKPSVLRKWIRFKSDLPFSLKTMKAVPFLSSRIPFAEEFSPPVLEWFGNQAIIHLYVRKSRNNSFSGILGILPQPQNSKPIITGNLDGSLTNLLGKGISMDFKWTRFAPSSQTAGLTLRLPVLDYSGLGLETNFYIFRQDSLINMQKADLQAITSSSTLWQFRFGLSFSSSSGRFGQVGLENARVSINSLLFGLYFDPQLPNKIQLKRTFISIQALPSVKKINSENQSATLNHFNFNSSGCYPVFSTRRFALLGKWNTGLLFSDQITVPDQFRLGGSRLLRGFNENYFFASQYFLSTIQPQVLLDEKLLAGVFSDFLVFSQTKKSDLFPGAESAIGFGFFSEFEIGSNLIQITFANGFSENLPFDFQATKIHFGYVARF